MGRKKLKGVHPRTINLDVESYDAILDFWRRSNTGISGALIVRELVKAYGKLCSGRINTGDYAVAEDVSNLGSFAVDFFRKGPNVTR
jgi:hypothetical protein